MSIGSACYEINSATQPQQSGLECDILEAERFLKLLDPNATGFSFQALDDARLPNGKSRDDKRLRQECHGSLTAYAAHLIRLNARFGAAIYAVINRTNLKGLGAVNVIGKRAVWADLDRGLPQRWLLPPSIIVQTSPGKYQAYWLLDSDISDADFVGILKHLAATYGGDPGVASIARVLRVPGFYHQKGAPFRVTIVEASGGRYNVAEIVAEHPPLIERKQADPLPAEIPETSRNRTLISAAGTMRKRGFSVEAVEAALQVLNRQQCTPPLDDKEVGKIARSSGKYPAGTLVQTDDAGAVVSHDRLALRFSNEHATDVKYVHRWRRWLVWDGKRWRIDETQETVDKVRHVARVEAARHEEERTRNQIESRWTVAAIESLAQSDRKHAETADAWDTDPWLLGTPAGTVDLRTGELLPARREDMVTKLTTVGPDRGRRPELWLKTLDQIFGGDLELIEYMQRLLGYSLTGKVIENVLVFFYGTGRNGKGVILNTWHAILGDYAVVAPKGMLEESKHERHPTEIARLRGARVVTAQETERGSRWAETTIKWLTGGDKLTGRYMHQDFFDFDPQFTLLISGNHKPKLRDVTPAVRERLHMVPFNKQFIGEERDPDLLVKLIEEWPAILAWAIEGCMKWRYLGGLAPPRAVKAATAAYLVEQDTIEGFLLSCCTFDDCTAAEDVRDLFDRFTGWCRENGKEPRGRDLFIEALTKRPGLTHGNDNHTRRAIFKGVQLVKPPLHFS